MIEYSLFAAFLVGLLGGVHCVGMCGGIVGALSFGLPAGREAAGRSLPFLLAYNLGRLSSYAVAGALAGGVTAVAGHLLDIRAWQQILLGVAGGFLILLGLYLAGWWTVLRRVEAVGSRVWRRIEPAGRRLLPVRHLWQALLLGGLWGWLPCGLVYSVLIWAMAAGSAREGALLLLAFGLGTLPNLLAMGLFAQHLRRFVGNPGVRRAAGVLVMAFGLLEVWRAMVSA